MYNRKSPRHPTHDYTSPGAYFITIITKNRTSYFGNIINKKLTLNLLGKHVQKCWNDVPHHYPFVKIDEFICMPNHIHGILIIGTNKRNNDVGTQNIASSIKIKQNDNTNSIVRMDNNPSLPKTIGAKSGSLGSIVRGFKIGVTKFAKQNNIAFGRQSRYHDHIIRDQNEYIRIKHYIKNNPKNRK